jgi:Tfp pilus assembly major pilin PilA
MMMTVAIITVIADITIQVFQLAEEVLGGCNGAL